MKRMLAISCMSGVLALPAMAAEQQSDNALAEDRPLSASELQTMPDVKPEEGNEDSIFDLAYDFGKRSGKWIAKQTSDIKLSDSTTTHDKPAAAEEPAPTPQAPQTTENMPAKADQDSRPPFLDRVFHSLGITR